MNIDISFSFSILNFFGYFFGMCLLQFMAMSDFLRGGSKVRFVSKDVGGDDVVVLIICNVVIGLPLCYHH